MRHDVYIHTTIQGGIEKVATTTNYIRICNLHTCRCDCYCRRRCYCHGNLVQAAIANAAMANAAVANGAMDSDDGFSETEQED